MDSALLPVGQIGRAHGIKGEVLVKWHGDNPIPVGAGVHLQMPDGKTDSLVVLKARQQKDSYIVLFDGINDRSFAEKLNGAVICLPKSTLPPLADDEAYLHDLEGCEIFLPDGKLVGRLDHVEFPAGRQVWSIKNIDDNEILFPAIPEFIVSLDPEHDRITIDPPDGLLEIYNA